MHPTERLKGIATFAAVAEAGSFTAAAQRLNLTNSAVGKAIARLEQRLGSRLFERSTRRLRLTDAGHAYYQVCVRVLEDLEAAERVLASDDAVPSGRLRVDLPATFGRLRAWPALLQFTAMHPQVLPQVSFTDRFVDLVEEGVDLAVRIGGADSDLWPAALDHRSLGDEELIFCAAPAYLAAHGTPTASAELSSHAALLYGRADGSASAWLLREGQGPAVRQPVTARAVLGNAEALVGAVEAGLGLAQLATWLVADQIADGRLVAILPQLATRGLPLHLVWQRSRAQAPKVQALLAHFSATLHIGA
ncbi:LysR family transcriptional regulator [Duganella sp. Leaf126]|uniref:LysR family transcriptional regulator n=1 Tax=Duganella sp. Leaf126 TaxID=1736266 RepID=UPI0006F5ACFD|nr:LysR family transcriptional regulator [Duganella sp. Leaf126]